MSEVKRYNTELEKDGGLGLPSLTMRSSSIGSWVEYKDYSALEDKFASLSAQLELSVAAERAWERTMMYACGEDGPKSVADKFAELESKLETALRECRSAGITIDNLEAKCSELATELSAVDKIHNEAVFITDDHYEQCPPEVQRMIRSLAVLQIPAYGAFLAEVRAQGVDAAIEAAKNLVAQEYEYKDFKAAQSDCCMHPGSDLVGKVEMTEWLVDFAAQLRKGGNQ